jgi:hypothetical protein
MAHVDIIERRLREWTAGSDKTAAMISVYSKIRDIPYGILPELNSPTDYLRIFERNMGSCTPKHLLLGNMLSRMGLNVVYVVYAYRWSEVEEIYPPHLRKLSRQMPAAKHLACKVEIDDRFVLVDATIDLPLGQIGIPVNASWDGKSDTALPILPIDTEEIYSPLEAELMPAPDLTDNMRIFYEGLNLYFQRIRHGK